MIDIRHKVFEHEIYARREIDRPLNQAVDLYLKPSIVPDGVVHDDPAYIASTFAQTVQD